MGYNPCCFGGSLQTWTKVVAILNIIRALPSLYSGVSLLIFGCRYAFTPSILALNENTTTTTSSPVEDMMTSGTSDLYLQTTPLPPLNQFQQAVLKKAIADVLQSGTQLVNIIGSLFILLSLFIIVEAIVTLVLSTILYKAASNRLVGNCRVWLIVKATFLLITIVAFPAVLALPVFGGLDNLWGVVYLIIDAYCVWVIYAFVVELKGEGLAKRVELGQVYHVQKA